VVGSTLTAGSYIDHEFFECAVHVVRDKVAVPHMVFMSHIYVVPPLCKLGTIPRTLGIWPAEHT
jgi:hypothetical protein